MCVCRHIAQITINFGKHKTNRSNKISSVAAASSAARSKSSLAAKMCPPATIFNGTHTHTNAHMQAGSQKGCGRVRNQHLITKIQIS